MVELSGATLVPGTIDVGGAADPARAPIRLRDARVDALLGVAVPRDRSAQILAALGFGVAERRRRPRRDRAAVSPQRRHPRGRPHRGGRAPRRLDELPATLPRRRDGAAGRLSAGAAPAPPRRGRARRPRRCTRSSAGASPTARRRPAARCPPTTRAATSSSLENPMSEDAGDPAPDARSARCWTSRATTSPAACATCARSSRAPSTAARRRSTLPHEHHALGALAHRRALRRRRWGTRSRRRPTSSPPRACSGAVLDALRVDWSVEPAAEPFLHPGRSAAGARRAASSVGWVGELHPLVAADLGPRAAPSPRSRSTSTRRRRARRRRARLPRPDELPGRCARTSRSSSPTTCRGRDVLATVREAGGKLLDDAPGLRRLPRRAGRGGPQVAGAALAFRAADRTLTDEDVAPVRDEDRRGAARAARR